MTSFLALRSRPKVDVVRKWLAALGVLTAGNTSRAEAEMKLRAYVPLLQERFPPGAFTQASLEYVAAQCRYFPSYSDVINHLGDWWRRTRPEPPELPPPPPPAPREPPTPEQVAYVEARVAECIASLRAAALYADQQAERLDDAREWQRERYLSPAQLDRLNPLPDGRKRAHAQGD